MGFVLGSGFFWEGFLGSCVVLERRFRFWFGRVFVFRLRGDGVILVGSMFYKVLVLREAGVFRLVLVWTWSN